MAGSLVVSALVDKRAEVAGLIEHAEKQLAQMRADLGHLDATIRLFDPEMAPETITPKKVRHRDGLFSNGEMPRLVLDALRMAGGAQEASVLAAAIMSRRGLDAADPALLERMTAKVSRALSRHKVNGLVEEAGRTESRGILWRIAG
ncbi:MAG TPA: hypothetical protein VEB64_09565 [Azospirillaceae bacterium]|nr:hypothetical protein [Azospirillaceae bacterium]